MKLASSLGVGKHFWLRFLRRIWRDSKIQVRVFKTTIYNQSLGDGVINFVNNQLSFARWYEGKKYFIVGEKSICTDEIPRRRFMIHFTCFIFVVCSLSWQMFEGFDTRSGDELFNKK